VGQWIANIPAMTLLQYSMHDIASNVITNDTVIDPIAVIAVGCVILWF
jgi:hypothetical protein